MLLLGLLGGCWGLLVLLGLLGSQPASQPASHTYIQTIPARGPRPSIYIYLSIPLWGPPPFHVFRVFAV